MVKYSHAGRCKHYRSVIIWKGARALLLLDISVSRAGGGVLRAEGAGDSSKTGSGGEGEGGGESDQSEISLPENELQALLLSIMFNLFEITSRSLREESNHNSQKHRSVSLATQQMTVANANEVQSLTSTTPALAKEHPLQPIEKNSSDQKIRKAVRKQVQPTKNFESNSTEFVIDIEGPYDAEDITGHTTDKTKFILVNYSNSSEEHKSQDPTQDESDNIPNKSTNVSNIYHAF
uniref:Uncharacterized protein n=1 Tax=Oryza sativa subsp. japonica TaxID=39947 RepID=Q6K1W5_ORYSJ|nr:hypothetical protein [Oryza sativa Japonica Group]